MIEPTGYTALDLIGFTDKGGYDPTANYVKNDIVTVGNTKWRCKIDDTTGVTPAENANWTIYLESATSLAGMSDVTLTSPKNGDGLVHDGNDWTNIPIMTKEQWKKNGAYNLQPIDVNTQVVNAVTFTVDKKGIKTQNAPSSTVYFLYSTKVYKAGTYRFCGCPTGGTNGTYCLVFRVYSGADSSTPSTDYYDTGDGIELTLTTNQLIKGWIFLFGGASGYDGTLKQFKPMITTDLNATYADYEPYAKTNGELTEDVAIEDISSGVSYASGVTSADVTFDVKRIGKLVIFTFMISTGSLMPTASWGATQILTGLPKSSSADRARISGATLTNKIPFAVVVNASGLCTIVKLQGGASTDTLPPYFGGVITYIEQ